MKKPHICFVGWADHVHLERWAGYFAENGYRVSVVSFNGPGRYPAGVQQYSVGLEGRGLRWVALKLRYLFWRIRPDIVHVHWAHFSSPVRLAWSGPLVVTAWGSDIYLRERFTDNEWTQTASALQTADLVTCDSDDLAAAIETSMAVPRHQIDVIQWGVDTQQFSPTGSNMRSALGLGNRPIVFSVRNFTPLYNLETVVDAFDRLLPGCPDAFLLMKCYGGESAYVEKIRSEIRQRGLEERSRIIETVPYEEMPGLLRTANTIVSIPHSDATPMSLLEAMSVGAIPVVSDLPSLREWVVDGRNGYLVPATDPEAVASALSASLLVDEDESYAMRSAAREVVMCRASQKLHMQSMVTHYRQIAGSVLPADSLYLG